VIGPKARRDAAVVLWLAGTVAIGVLAVLPVGFGVTAATRLSDGQLAAHHAGTEVLGTTSPFPVDNDEVAVALMFGVLGVGILLGPLTWLAVLARRHLPPGGKATAATTAATLILALAPTIWIWLRLG
jgi:hypothetical protein